MYWPSKIISVFVNTSKLLVRATQAKVARGGISQQLVHLSDPNKLMNGKNLQLTFTVDKNRISRGLS